MSDKMEPESLAAERTPEDKPRRARRGTKAAETRQAIVNAALAEFLERGFAGARLEDIAKRAGVAKGTIYLYFKDKEALFEGIVRQMILPYSERMEANLKERLPETPTDFLENHLLPFIREIQADRRVDVLRLLISDGPRFPALAGIYFRVVIEPNVGRLRALLARSVKPEAEILVEFPQLVISPIVAGLMWNTLFDEYQPLELEKMLRGHFRLMSHWLQDPPPT